MTRFHSSLLVAGALILFVLLSPLMRYGNVSDANEKLTSLYKQFAELKNNKGISDEDKQSAGSKLQMLIENQKNAVKEAELNMDKKTTNELIVITCLGLMLIWIVFWNIPILYLSFTAIALAISVYAFLRSNFNLDLLDYDTMARIFVLCVGVVGTILFFGIILIFLFNKTSAIGVRDMELASNPIAIAAHAKSLELNVVSQAQQLAFNRIGQITDNDFKTFDMMKDRHINKESWSYNQQTGWNERPVNEPNFQSANNHSSYSATSPGKGA